MRVINERRVALAVPGCVEKNKRKWRKRALPISKPSETSATKTNQRKIERSSIIISAAASSGYKGSMIRKV